MAEFLIEHGAEINHNNETHQRLLSTAVDNGNTPMAELLIEHGAEINHNNETHQRLLSTAVDNGNTPMAELLIEHGAEINHNNETHQRLLSTAVDNGNTPMAELLIEHGANVNYKDIHNRSILMKAVGSGCIPMVELLIKHKADINNNGQVHCPLSVALNKGDIDMVFTLIRKGANIDVANKNQLTELMKKYDTTPEALATTPFRLEALAYRQVFALTKSRKIPIDYYPLPPAVKEVLKDRKAFPFYRLASANN